MASNSKLSDQQKSAVVIMLACYWQLKDVLQYVRDEWGIEVAKQSIQRYDPTKVNGQRDLAKKWCDIFHATRSAFLKEKAMHAVSHMPYRMGIYQKVIEEGLRRHNYDLVLRSMEQAAKDEGGSYTNRQRVDIDQHIRTGVMRVPFIDNREEALKLIADQQANVPGGNNTTPN